MSAPWQFWSASQLASATGCPQADIEANWPLILGALEARGIADRPVQIAALGTIAIETASTFRPVREAFWLDDDWRREYLRYYPYYGRGYIQLTWAENYTAYGNDIGVDLHTEPDRALEPPIAAQVLAAYFAQHGGGAIPRAARDGDWPKVRRLVQGGTAGLDRLVAIATTLEGAVPMPTTPTYDPTTPVVPQNHDWDCAEQSTLWAMTAFGRHPSDAWMEASMLTSGIESTELGLLVGNGSQLAAWITEQYGEFGYRAYNAASVSFDDVRSVAGASPVMIGGHGWGSAGHWSGVRQYDPQQGTLVLANPGGSGPIYGQTSLDRQQFTERGPWSMVVVTHESAVAPEPPVPPPVDELAALRAENDFLRAEVVSLKADLGDRNSRLGVASVDYARGLRDLATALEALKP